MKIISKFLKCLPFLVGLTLLLISPSYAAMNDYCIVPPFVVAGVKPNLLLMLDNSASLYDLAFTASATNSFCYDNSYDNNKSGGYAGYFDQATWYTSEGVDVSRYCSNAQATACTSDLNCPGGKCVLKDTFTNSQFTEYPGPFPIPGCTFSTSYLCVTTAGTTPDNVTKFVASGRFLNWLSASKMDIEKWVLTGGKYDSATKLLIGETRGCVGLRLIKEVPTADWQVKPADGSMITFGVRGRITDLQLPAKCLDSDPECTTRIDIFKGNFNWEACRAAINEWTSPTGNLGTAKQLTQCCMGEGTYDPITNKCTAGGGGGGIQPPYNHALQTCWTWANGQAIGAGDVSRIKQSCENLYNTADPATLPYDSKGYVCVKDTNLKDPDDPTDPGGYVGICWKDKNDRWIGVPAGITAEDCIARELEDYCKGIKIPEIVDPSELSQSTSQLWNIPATLVDSGALAQLGNPIRTYHLYISKDPAPYGIIQRPQFKDLIRFGVMTFNDFGSKTECLTPDSHIVYTCEDINDKDGAKIIHYIGQPDPGNPLATNYIAGLTSAINNIRARTWTPYSEGLYNAIAYFTQNTNPDVTKKPYRLNVNDFTTNINPIQYKCQSNNVLLISDGMSTTDQHSDVMSFVTSNNNGGQITSVASPTYTVKPVYFGSKNLDDLSWYGHTASLTNPNVTWADKSINNITTHVVYTGIPCSDKDSEENCTTTDESVPEKLMQLTAQYGDGTYQRAENPDDLYKALEKAFLEISGEAASGTAASVLASGEGSGANLVQAIFYPKRTFYYNDPITNEKKSNQIEWIGSLKNLWYHIDPFLGNSTIREDTVKDQILNLREDDIINFFFDKSDSLTKANLFDDSDGDGVADDKNGDGVIDQNDAYKTVYFEDVKSLWEAGLKLWVRSPGDRVIYTTTDGSSTTSFSTANTTTLRPFLLASSDTEASQLISYIRGHDKFCSITIDRTCSLDTDCPAGETCKTPLRNRMIAIDLNKDGDTLDTVDGISESLKVWKLGDIVNSTPRIASLVPLNKYHKAYLDITYKDFVNTPDYKNRGMVFVGANDGMLHAFRLGKLELFEEKYKKAEISGTDIGKEEWAFIPKNVLPYLQYLADKSYCHVYNVDLTTYLVDVSMCAKGSCSGDYWDQNKTVDSWRTILIGGMRFGGACKDAPATAYEVETPASGKGFSSYFAVDITNTLADPTNPPEILWEFSHNDLGFSTTGPALVRISAKQADGITPDHNKNGRWFVAFGSGPTGPIDTNTHQFKGYSDQDLKIFILDLKTGELLRTIDTNIPYAFAGSLMQAAIDFDQNDTTKPGFYQDDALYFGFVKAENNPPVATTKWNVGGVIRIFTNNSINPDPDWVWSRVIDNIGPVNAGVAKLQNYKNNTVRLFFGTGRYFYKISDIIDDADNGRSLYGVKEPCYSSGGLNTSCATTVSRGDLGNASLSATGTADSDGWYIDLDTSTVDLKAERNVTDPLATTIGAVFFTTTKPSADVCSFGGASHLWAVKYDTGGKVSSSVLRGRALLQVSTGTIEEVSLKSEFREREGRRTAAYVGVPPAGTPPGIIVPPSPINKIIHIREK